MTMLRKTLGPIQGAALMLNIVIGAGLLSLPGLAYEVSGADAIWAWLLCASVSLPLLLTFIIMGARFPNAGGVAHFAQMAFGRFAYIAASFLFLGAVLFGLPAIALTGGYYLSELIPLPAPIFALLLLGGAALTQTLSPAKASIAATALSSVIIVMILGVVAIGLIGVFDAAPSNRSIAPLPTNMSLMIAPFMMIFFAFTGWEVAAGLSEEFRNPKRDFPLAMILSFIVAVTLYAMMALIVHFTPIEGAYAAVFISILSAQLGSWSGTAMAVLAGIIIFANLMGAVWAVSRMVFSLSRENVLPLSLNLDDQGRPVSAVLCVSTSLMLVTCLDMIGWLKIDDMLAIAGQNFLILYVLAAAALLLLAKSLPERMVAFLSVVVAGVLLAWQGLALAYPAALIIVAGLLHGGKRLGRKVKL